MKSRTKMLVAIGGLLVSFCISGCKMVRDVDIGNVEMNGESNSNKETFAPIMVKDGAVFDEESIISYFYGEDRKSLLEDGYLEEVWYEDNLIEFQCAKDEIELLYGYNYALDVGDSRNFFILHDRRGTPDGETYSGKLKIKTGIWNHWMYQLMTEYPEGELESCTREDAISACAPLAEACGYGDAQVRLYTMIDEFAGKKDPEAYILIYQTILNGLVLDSFPEYGMICIYVPEYGRVVYAKAYQPFVLEQVLDETKLISKEEAVAQAILELRIESTEDITIMNTSIVYSPENRKVGFYEKEKTINPCWRIDYILSEELLKQPLYEAYNGGTIMIDAIEGRISEFLG